MANKFTTNYWQLHFSSNIRGRIPGFFKDTKVAKVDSLSINGFIRNFFSASEYVGFDLDLDHGSGVCNTCNRVQ
jgi:hypothetical protein